MSEVEEFDYDLPENGKAIAAARKETGLEKEIAVLRVKLKRYVSNKQADIGLILAVINSIGRALLVQARIGGGDPDAARRARATMRYFGEILASTGKEQAEERKSAARSKSRAEQESSDEAGSNE